MKKIIFILMLATLFGCKKDNQEPEKVLVEYYDASDTFIKANKWQIVGAYNFGNNEHLVWKLRAVGTDRFLMIDPAPDRDFWREDYQKGDILDGQYVFYLRN